MLLAIVLAACTYEDAGNPTQTASAEHSSHPAPAAPTKSPEILGAETRNFAELKNRLATAQGVVILDDSGPADGPGVGFSKTVKVQTAGRYTVTVACVGIPAAHVFLSAQGRRICCRSILIAQAFCRRLSSRRRDTSPHC
ncbi:hypothetical protein OOZ51_05375 [Arthrobacter sp. MI7-26]|uniref:hypothetical protein n=1 Tax=Arthrobacter sp. MI7-26 TaxID=2993653 RepID=UPI0022495364|nr:hypothetical protein [Arthrobacter sp. MI7-26]MCX2747246.1 hypothetical protein [Arthrobacter sp. MI7-26]